jgi:hypothetical protein
MYIRRHRQEHQSDDRKSQNNMLKKIWNAIKIFKSTGIRILNSNVKAALFYGAET